MWSRIKSWLDWLLPVGPRSVLFGAHQFLIHPVAVAIAWGRLYGFPRDPRLYVAFFVHDLGYLFQWCRSMDGEDGERHVLFGAWVMHVLFDWPRTLVFRDVKYDFDGEGNPFVARAAEWRYPNNTWRDFARYHSRFWAKRDGKKYSRLCVADKLGTALEPAWLYLPRIWLSGELREFMANSGGQPGSKYNGMPRTTAPEELEGLGPVRAWHVRMVNHMRKWVEAHRDGAEDTWTPAPAGRAA